MKTLLQINTSLFSDESSSSSLASEFVEKWRQANPGSSVIVRDLATDPVPHLTAERFEAFGTAADERDAQQAAYAEVSDRLIEELEAADIVVMGLPMYNFGIPSTLKAWIDHVARAGKTFKYGETGPIGMLADRPVHIFATRGGFYHGTPRDTQSAYMTHFLNFIGLRDIEFIYAEGLNMGGDKRQAALADARESIDRLAA